MTLINLPVGAYIMTLINLPVGAYIMTLINLPVGEASGKASRSVAKHLLGPTSVDPAALSGRAGAATSEIGRAKMLAIERGQKLGELEERTQRMVNESESFASHAHSLMMKYRDKKWYQL